MLFKINYMNYFCVLPLFLFSLNSIAESDPYSDDIHENQKISIDYRSNPSEGICRYFPSLSLTEEEKICGPYVAPYHAVGIHDNHWGVCAWRYKESHFDELALTKTIPKNAKCPESVTIGFNNRTKKWSILK